MTKALRNQFKVGQVYEVTNHYINRPDHPSFGTRTATITKVNTAAFFLDGNRIPFPNSGQIELQADGRVLLYGGGAGQGKEQPFLSLVPQALSQITPAPTPALVQDAGAVRVASLSPPEPVGDTGIRWDLKMPYGNVFHLKWSYGETAIYVEKQGATGAWVQTEMREHDYRVADGHADTASEKVLAFVEKLNDYLLGIQKPKTIQSSANRVESTRGAASANSEAASTTPATSVEEAAERSVVGDQPELSRTPLGDKRFTKDLPPTVDAINEWLGQSAPYRRPDGPLSVGSPRFGVDIRTKTGSWRYITSPVMHAGELHYWTIRGEGSSNGGRETAIPASKIFAARAHYSPGYEAGKSRSEATATTPLAKASAGQPAGRLTPATQADPPVAREVERTEQPTAAREEASLRQPVRAVEPMDTLF